MAMANSGNWDEDSFSSGTDSDEGVSVDDIISREISRASGDCPPTFLRKSGKNLEWDYFLLKKENLKHVAPVKLFRHAPLSNIADNFFTLNVHIECFNPYVKCDRTVNWIAKLVHFAGYRALVKYETFDCEESRFGWIDFCSDVPKPIGYSARNDILLFPPYDVRRKYPHFLDEMKRCVPLGCPTLPLSHLQTVKDAILATQKYKIADKVEIVDNCFTGQNWLATVTGIIGDRIHCTYFGREKSDSGFWLNCQSESVHDLGFSHAIGYTLAGIPTNFAEIYDKTQIMKDFCIPFTIEVGMVLEARHPFFTYRIAYCKIIKVLKFGYFCAEFESEAQEDGHQSLQYMFHITSPYIFPCGFSKSHGIKLLVPKRENPKTFDWNEFCKKKSLKPLPLEQLLQPQKTGNPFEVGMKLEAVDVCRPAYLGPATVTKVVEHLLLLHFDGWTRDNEICYQWSHFYSPDIYPLGWAALVGHELQSFPENHKLEDEVNRKNKLPNILF